MTDAEIITLTQEALQVTSRAELEHVLSCGDCYLFDRDDGGGPHYCRAFDIDFRGYVPREPTPESVARGAYMVKLWGPMIREALAQSPPMRQLR